MPSKKLQPKDARAIPITYRYDDDDDLSELMNDKRPRTANDVLIEFLDRGPEGHASLSHPSKSTNIFSMIKKNKRNSPNTATSTASSVRSIPSSTTSLPMANSTSTSVTLNHHSPDMYPTTVVPQKTKSATITSHRATSFSNHHHHDAFHRNSYKTNSAHEPFIQASTGEPILPNKKRESSLYSGPLRHSVSVRSQMSTASYRRRSVPSGIKATELVMAKSDTMDAIEFALAQRLERMKVVDEPLPSDQVAIGLSSEHIRALGITHILDNSHHEEEEEGKSRNKKIRHMQVQTEVSSIVSDAHVSVEHESPKTGSRESNPELRAKRAEAALENAYDHLEVMSGLAYKKLRELWEEKMRWETACMELRDRLLAMEQKQQESIQLAQDSPLLREDYRHHVLIEDEDELGLSEFPMTEPKREQV
ncbi:hypothetical protein BD560DRAFT_417099 [Blakeslea trispora]|nr:hypothetical protein BD560DRAFT_417099 [Blakeslea trispora]